MYVCIYVYMYMYIYICIYIYKVMLYVYIYIIIIFHCSKTLQRGSKISGTCLRMLQECAKSSQDSLSLPLISQQSRGGTSSPPKIPRVLA